MDYAQIQDFVPSHVLQYNKHLGGRTTQGRSNTRKEATCNFEQEVEEKTGLGFLHDFSP